MEERGTPLCHLSDRSASLKDIRGDSPRNIKWSYYQTRRRDSRSASPQNVVRSASTRNMKSSNTETSSSSIGSQNARVKPKDFRTPLTCFFWFQTGDCKKSDNKCLYAHYHTGLIAEPPVSYQGKTMGGVRAKKVLGNINQREEEITVRAHQVYDAEQRLAGTHAALVERVNALAEHEQTVHQHEQAIFERENAVTAREQATHEREIAFAEFEEGMLRKLEEEYHGVTSIVQQIRRAVGNAQRILVNRREQVLHHENMSNSLQGVRGQGRYSGSIAIDGAVGAMGGLDQTLSEAEVKLAYQIWNAIRIK